MKHFNWLFLILLTVAVINYPNPFNPKGGEVSTLECTSDTATGALLYIYDMSARLLLNKTFNLSVGTSRTSWNGYSDGGQLAGSGVYLYRIIDSTSKKSLAKGKIWVINR